MDNLFTLGSLALKRLRDYSHITGILSLERMCNSCVFSTLNKNKSKVNERLYIDNIGETKLMFVKILNEGRDEAMLIDIILTLPSSLIISDRYNEVGTP
ncbi:unnamed protein product [Dovyalis caffra]|uniref:Uncharacterized protein n=1 Tax=Dovyalis caffra TaxID=77055 RepID=A0AAV1SF37_9ROSI|nr:unnamed protein product [Dovyalis caffra]